MKRVCIAIKTKFEAYHMKQLTRADFDKQLAINVDRGFPGMFTSLNFMHYE
jgi:hypothetical protein